MSRAIALDSDPVVSVCGQALVASIARGRRSGVSKRWRSPRKNARALRGLGFTYLAPQSFDNARIVQAATDATAQSRRWPSGQSYLVLGDLAEREDSFSMAVYDLHATLKRGRTC